MDPTSGWTSLSMNYASMYNRGIELNLNTINISQNGFEWSTAINFSYNRNMVTSIENSGNSIGDHIFNTNTRAGMPIGTFYNTRYAGLDELGNPQAYKADGTIAKSLAELTVNDLVKGGTTVPPFAASLTNNLTYKGFDLSFSFIFYGGHVLRDVMPKYLTTTSFKENPRRSITNYWKKPEDSKVDGMAPAFKRNASNNSVYMWYAADVHMKKADYFKLRDINIGYTFNTSLLKKIKIAALRLNVQLSNVWFWGAQKNRLNPEHWSGNYLLTAVLPQDPITISFGLNIKF